MSHIDQAMKANEQFAKKYDPKLGGHPQPKIAVVTCMDLGGSRTSRGSWD